MISLRDKLLPIGGTTRVLAERLKWPIKKKRMEEDLESIEKQRQGLDQIDFWPTRYQGMEVFPLIWLKISQRLSLSALPLGHSSNASIMRNTFVTVGSSIKARIMDRSLSTGGGLNL